MIVGRPGTPVIADRSRGIVSEPEIGRISKLSKTNGSSPRPAVIGMFSGMLAARVIGISSMVTPRLMPEADPDRRHARRTRCSGRR